MPKTLEELRLAFAKRDPIHSGRYGVSLFRTLYLIG